MLRSHLQQTAAETIPPLHQRAGAWFEAQELWPEAVYHALAAADYATAARLIERVGLALFAQSSIQHSIERWLSVLPAAFITARPRLCLLQAWMCFSRVELATGLQWVAKAEGTGEAESAAETAAMRAMLTAYSANLAPDQALTYGQQALATLPAEQYALRGIAAAAVGMAYVKQCDLVEAEAAFAEAIRISRHAGGLYIFATVASNQAAVQRAQGLLNRALATCRDNLAWLIEYGALPYPTFSALYLQLADLLREQNALAEAQHYAETAIAHNDRGIKPGDDFALSAGSFAYQAGPTRLVGSMALVARNYADGRSVPNGDSRYSFTGNQGPVSGCDSSGVNRHGFAPEVSLAMGAAD